MKFTISREEAIPFREQDWTVIQMVQYRNSVSVTQEEWETLEEIEKKLGEVYTRNMERIMSKDPVYQRQKQQLIYLANQIKEHIPTKAKDIILTANRIKNEDTTT